MKRSSYTLEFIMPCFCAGADQSRAEVRASSVRGQLRWWFRALGGNAFDERTIFGSVAGTASASSLIVRISGLSPGPAWNPPRIDPNSPDSYVWHFASVSGKAPGSGRSSLGPRWTSAGALPAKTAFHLELLQRGTLIPSLQEKLDLAVRCFLQLGAIGLRATRGLGTFACREEPFAPALLSELQACGFAAEIRPKPLDSPDSIAREIGGLLKGTRKALNMKADQPSPFGTSSPRQTSAIYFRPVRGAHNTSDCQLVVFEAPHTKVLGPTIARLPRVIGHNPTQLQYPAPVGRRG